MVKVNLAKENTLDPTVMGFTHGGSSYSDMKGLRMEEQKGIKES